MYLKVWRSNRNTYQLGMTHSYWLTQDMSSRDIRRFEAFSHDTHRNLLCLRLLLVAMLSFFCVFVIALYLGATTPNEILASYATGAGVMLFVSAVVIPRSIRLKKWADTLASDRSRVTYLGASIQADSRISNASPSAETFARVFGLYNWTALSDSPKEREVISLYFQETAEHDILLADQNIEFGDKRKLESALERLAERAVRAVNHEREVNSTVKKFREEYIEAADLLGKTLEEERQVTLHTRVEQVLAQPR